MILLVDLSLLLLSLPVLLCSSYLLVATALSSKLQELALPAASRCMRFVVPAHNEGAGIEATVQSLLAVDYDRAAFDVLVIADNCDDDTAERARSAGATVLVRTDAELRGKGYALLLAFSTLPDGIDAVVVVDADSVVSPNILHAFAARRDLGAHAIQADYAVRNPNASWRTRLIAIALGAFHVVRSRARERLGLSCGLRGNGMCFSVALLREVPHNAFSIVEDVEYGLRLGQAGHRVHYADEAHVYGEMVSTAAAAASQRRRWEQGRRDLVAQNASRLLREGLAQRDPVLLDLALDLLIPPLSRVASLAVFGFLLTLGVSVALRQMLVSCLSFGVCVFAVLLYVLRGWSVSGTGLRGLLDLALAPLYVIWKMSLRLKRDGDATSWVRTKRERH